MRLKIAWATDPGLEREENEDSVMVWRNKAGLDTLIVVCDGMGGHAAGQHASSIAVKTVTKVMAEDGQEGPDVDRLKRALKQANTAVFEAAHENPDWSGMGSTMVIAAIRNGECALLNVGDSPAYLIRNREAKLISRDIVTIDLRLPDRVTVRLSAAAAQARADALKEKKPPAKKGGPA